MSYLRATALNLSDAEMTNKLGTNAASPAAIPRLRRCLGAARVPDLNANPCGAAPHRPAVARSLA